MNPDKLIVFLGPDKAGSTFFWDTLKKHPSISTSPAKELFFFDKYYSRGIPWYLDQFGSSCTALDVSHDYLFDALACDRLGLFIDNHFVSGEVLAVVSLRDPLERAVSAYKYMLWQGRTRLPFNKAVFEISELLDHGNYGCWLPMWEKTLGDRLVLIDFQELVGDVAPFNSLLERLGLDGLESADLAKNVNSARESSIPAPIMRAGRRVGCALRNVGLIGVQSKIKEFVVCSSFLNTHESSDPLNDLNSSESGRLKDILVEMNVSTSEYVDSEVLFGWRLNWDRKLGVSC